MTRTVFTLLIMMALAGCTEDPGKLRDTAMIDGTAEALGGKDRIQGLKTLIIEGEATAPNLGQNLTPGADLPTWKVTEFRRSIDLPNGRMRVKQVRTAQFLFAGATTQSQEFGVDAEVAYNIGDSGPTRGSQSAVRDRRIEMLHHPLTLVRAAYEPGAMLGNRRQFNTQEIIEITTAAGELLTLTVDRATKTPLRVSSLSYNPNLGDVVIETSFAEYETVNGIRVPRRLTTKIDKYPQFDLQVTKNTIDGEAGDLSAPADVKSASLPPAAAVTVTAEPVAKGIWWLAGSGNHRSILFEFDDHLVLFEVPQSEARTKAVIDTARTLSPKPLTHAVVSHHHFDHSGGLRVAVAEGLTIITHALNVELFEELVARKHTVVQDALARNPKPLKIERVEDMLTLKDNSMEVQLFHLKNNPREGTNLFAYTPRDRILVQADMYDAGWLQHPWGDNLAYNVSLRKLQVEKSVPVHGKIESYAEVLKTIQSKK